MIGRKLTLRNSIHMPNLTTSIGSPVPAGWVTGLENGIEIISIGNPFSLNLPKLSNTVQLTLLGNFLK